MTIRQRLLTTTVVMGLLIISGCPMSRSMTSLMSTPDFLPTFSDVPPQSEPDPDVVYGRDSEGDFSPSGKR